jgi:hypothetical protein
MVMDGNASDAKDAIYGLLYQKVGERIDSMKAEVRSGNTWTKEETPSQSESEN